MRPSQRASATDPVPVVRVASVDRAGLDAGTAVVAFAWIEVQQLNVVEPGFV